MAPADNKLCTLSIILTERMKTYETRNTHFLLMLCLSHVVIFSTAERERVLTTKGF